jgi:pyridoxine 5-phosphate synthase
MLHSSLPYSSDSIKELELPRYELASRLEKSLEELQKAAKYAKSLGLEVAAGHGLNYHNIASMLDIQEITELNIGQSIIARSVFSGLAEAVREMKKMTTR